ncbi:MAG: DUF523 domain-containing protein [Candidatus Marinimicrobia bacterium]|jgi:uncharacterized protein YbbK (DUF523 family)|nr:DUF523 domain-containing protein [Candidatus Neomarinimicrobiota bacterium]MBT3630083.1 DUF523 domain-containing protein [Candidatus Neomarinimicrobiota bacterium]MBT3824250.1 DUF523 domain-containing protein [Candidatus Neomarinimicrobiota bacterium]MBT4131702.1 DUF523 domain-containing protein [Candidatus Neomarinimicrobiota bacterium]MBT4295468.1 DUF523 domain-containing protein [Candidatus Neomarinimicrobiota bacterium]
MSNSVLISACLLGEACRFDGRGKHNSELSNLLKDKTLIAVCPEVAGGLPIPRPPAEIVGDQVLRQNGEDVSLQFQSGAELCRDKGLAEGTNLAILKSRSPACGCGRVYDGTFSGTLVEGDGIFTQHLKAAGVNCISDEDFLSEKGH